MTYMYTKFDDCSYCNSIVMTGGPKIYNWLREREYVHLRDSLSSWGVYIPKYGKISVKFSVPHPYHCTDGDEIWHVRNFTPSVHHVTPEG